MTGVRFTVRGVPVAQGSPKAFIAGGKARVVSGASRSTTPLGAWRLSIASEARQAMTDLPSFDGPVTVAARFVMSRPPSHFRTDGKSLVRTASRYPRLDVDKLARSLLDALTGVCFDDDSQVTELVVTKAWDDEARGWQGVTVEVST